MGLAERIAKRLHCAGCGRRFQTGDLQMVGVGSGELDLYMHCGGCGLYLYLTVPQEDMPAPAVVATVAGPTLERQEEPRGLPVTAEDVAEMRDFLSSFDGDVRTLLGMEHDSP